MDRSEPPTPLLVRDILVCSSGAVATTPTIGLAAVTWVECCKEHHTRQVPRKTHRAGNRLIVHKLEISNQTKILKLLTATWRTNTNLMNGICDRNASGTTNRKEQCPLKRHPQNIVIILTNIVFVPLQYADVRDG